MIKRGAKKNFTSLPHRYSIFLGRYHAFFTEITSFERFTFLRSAVNSSRLFYGDHPFFNCIEILPISGVKRYLIYFLKYRSVFSKNYILGIIRSQGISGCNFFFRTKLGGHGRGWGMSKLNTTLTH